MKIRLSHSALDTLHECERKFQLDRLLTNGVEKEDSSHTQFGKSFGAGVASYLLHQDTDRAMFEAWTTYYPQIEDEKKNQAKCMNLLQQAFFSLDDLLQDYEVVEFHSKPAVELSFRLNIDETYYFVGYIDVVLKNRYTGQYVIFEVKTTGLELHDLDPLYKNSGQALGYSIALDRITGKELTSYGVIYFVGQLGRGWEPKIRVLPYNKTLLDRLNWFITLGLDVKHLIEMAELGVYPKRGSSCLSFMRPCKHFGVCDLHALDQERVIEEDTIDYQFTYDLNDMVQDHIKRLGALRENTNG